MSYDSRCDAIRKAELNTIDHGMCIVPLKKEVRAGNPLLPKKMEKKVIEKEGDDDPWSNPLLLYHGEWIWNVKKMVS